MFDKVSQSVVKYVLVPFIKEITTNLIEKTNPEIIQQIKDINVNDPMAIQMVLQLVVTVTNPSISKERRKWLFEYEEI